MATQRAPRHGHHPPEPARAAAQTTPATPPTPPAPQITGMTAVRPLGSGGFSRVYLYEQDFPRRVTAVKVLTGDFRDAPARAAFTAEANAMGRLSTHPSIVSLWAAGITTTGAPYLALEFCPGSMRDRTRKQPAPLHEVLDAGVRLAGALESAHRAGLLHRDIKPSNVLITAAGRPALSDFGITLLNGSPTPHTHAANPAAHALTVPWSAPEVVTRHTAGTVASEVWALGATLYTFATGRSPFEHTDVTRNSAEEVIRRITAGAYAPITATGNPTNETARTQETAIAAVNSLLARALTVHPQQRYTSMREFGTALQRTQQQCGYPVTPIDIIEDGWAGDTTTPQRNTQPANTEAPQTPQPSGGPRTNSRAAQRAAAANTTPPTTNPPPAGSRTTTRIVSLTAGATGLIGIALIAWWAAQNLGGL